MIKTDITIAFSGYNIKYFAVLAIESLLLQYPNLRNSIVYFDDESTDGTIEELNSRGIKVITWSDNYKLQYKKFEEQYDSNKVLLPSVRVSFIMREIMEQTKTKYLMINDGDVFFNGNTDFIDKYNNEFNNGSKIVFRTESAGFDNIEYRKYKETSLSAYNYYSKYLTIGEISLSKRLHMLHMVMDLDYFKSIDMLGDRLVDNTFCLMDGGLVDTGTDFYHQVIESNIKSSSLDKDDIFNILFHWGWLSSSNRVKSGNANNNRDFIKLIKESTRVKGLNKMLNKMLNKIGITIDDLLSSYIRNEEIK